MASAKRNLRPDMELESMLAITLGAAEGIPMLESMAISDLTAPGRHGERDWHLARDMSPQTRKDLLCVGFVFPEETEADRRDTVLVPVIAPPGWAIKRSDGLWSYILDHKGQKRGSLGYKGVSYDRWASTSLTTRFRVETDYSHRPETPGDMPPEIQALQVKKKFLIQREVRPSTFAPVSFPKKKGKKSKGYPPRLEIINGRPIAIDENGYEVYFPDYLESLKQELEEQYEERVVDTFDPYHNQEHKGLPYRRFFVKDNATGKRVWEGPWLTIDQYRRVEGQYPVVKEPHPEWTGDRWLSDNFPDAGSVLAYW